MKGAGGDLKPSRRRRSAGWEEDQSKVRLVSSCWSPSDHAGDTNHRSNAS